MSQWEPEKEIKFQNEDVRADNETDNNELPTFIFSVEAFENRRSSKASLTELGVFIKQTILRDLGRRYDDLTVVFSSNRYINILTIQLTTKVHIIYNFINKALTLKMEVSTNMPYYQSMFQ